MMRQFAPNFYTEDINVHSSGSLEKQDVPIL